MRPGDLLTTSEAADWLGLTTRSLYQFVHRGELTPVMRGRPARFTVLELELFVEAHRVRPGTLRHLYPAELEGR